ncbi:MAG TPA: excinuclease ABC subunit UvrC, partial [Actinomycetota bacterium]|nr:excinuclease ABC subunit UvrC [Actinomycetota bacterium]
KKKGDKYYGPYTHAYAIRETLDLLLRVFPLRSCSRGVFDRARSSNRPCLLYDIGRCSGPCVGHVDPDEHRRIVESFCTFMDGRHDEVVRDLTGRMNAAAGAQEFEHAARLRDQLSAVRRVIEKQQMVTERPEDLDVIAYSGDELEASFQVFFVRGGRTVGRKGFIVDRVEDLSEPELVSAFIERLYSEPQEVPKEILVPLVPDLSEVLEEWLSLIRGSKVKVRVPERGAKRSLIQTVEQNAKDAFAQNRLKRANDFDSRSRALAELQKELDLPEAPLRIECFDISNLGPTEVVGSMVVFEDALPKKSDYRKFKIRGFEGQDDVGSMGEVIERRFTRFLEEKSSAPERGSKFAYQPGLVVIDGGKGQLNRAVDVLSDMGVVGIPVVALAKRLEEVFLPGGADPRIIPRGSEALYLLQRIRDEAHRFALGYQRNRRVKSLTDSVLDGMDGVGPTRRKALLKQFGSVKRLREAAVEEIAAVPGIGRDMAAKIHTYLHSEGRLETGSARTRAG